MCGSGFKVNTWTVEDFFSDVKHAGVSIEVATTREKDHSDKIQKFSLGSTTFGLLQLRQMTTLPYGGTIISVTKAFVGREQGVNKVGACVINLHREICIFLKY